MAKGPRKKRPEMHLVDGMRQMHLWLDAGAAQMRNGNGFGTIETPPPRKWLQ